MSPQRAGEQQRETATYQPYHFLSLPVLHRVERGFGSDGMKLSLEKGREEVGF